MQRISNDPQIQAEYEAMRARGESHRMAELLALQSPPYGKDGNRILFQGRCNGNQFERQPKIGNAYRKIAEGAGVSTAGKVYLGQLADFPGDPKAWVANTTDVKRVCEERNLTCRGAVSHKGHEAPGTPDIPIAEDIVQEHVAREVALDPSKAKRLEDTREKVRNRLLPNRITKSGVNDEVV